MEHESQIKDLREALPSAVATSTGGRVVAVSLSSLGPSTRPLLRFEIEHPQGKRYFVAEVLHSGYPRDIRDAAWRLSDRPADLPDKWITMVAAPHLSDGAREELRRRGIGYFDGSGSLFLRDEHWLIDIQREAKKIPRQSGTLFSESREMVVHALLNRAYQWVTGAELAKAAKTSQFTCSIVLQELERQELVESVGSGRTVRRRLRAPAALLDAWAAAWTARKQSRRQGYVFALHPERLAEQIARSLKDASAAHPWAFTGAIAANLHSPMLTAVDVAELIVPAGSEDYFATTLGMEPADVGGNVVLIARDGASMLFAGEHVRTNASTGETLRIPLASPFIQYLDLLDGKRRNKEMAARLLEEFKSEWANYE